MRQIQEKYEQLNNIEIIKDKKSEDTNSINLNDVVRLSFKYPDGEVEEEVVKLIAASQVSVHDNFTEISVNSPVGKVIYKKNVGDVVEYVAWEKKVTS
jgi:transcription elongation GreA/GreB family factor